MGGATGSVSMQGGGGDYMDQQGKHWIDDHIATPMSKYKEYEQSRKSFGINVLGTLIVVIEADNGQTRLCNINRRTYRMFYCGKTFKSIRRGKRGW